MKNFNEWTSEGPDRELIIHDAYTGEPVDVNSPPEWVYNDRLLDKGYQALMVDLHHNGLVIGAFYTAGDTRAEDLGRRPTQADFDNADEDFKPPAEVLIAESQAVCYVKDGLNYNDEQTRLAFPWVSGEPLQLTGNGYLDRISTAFTDYGSNAFSVGLEYDESKPIEEQTELGHAERKLLEMRQMIDYMETLPGTHDEAMVAAIINYENAAQWVRVLRIGACLGPLATEFKDEGKVLQNSLLIVPNGLIDMSRKLISTQVTVTNMSQFENTLVSEDTHFVNEIMKLGHIPYGDRHKDS